MDEPLNDNGRMQAREASRVVSEIRPEFVIYSTLQRARETAMIAAGDLEDVEFLSEPDIRERGCGNAEGLTTDEILDRFGIRMEMSSSEVDRIPGAEPLDAFRDRIMAAMGRLYEEYRNRRVLLVSHGGVMRTFYNQSYSGLPEGIVFRNCSIISLARAGDLWRIVDKHNTAQI